MELGYPSIDAGDHPEHRPTMELGYPSLTAGDHSDDQKDTVHRPRMPQRAWLALLLAAYVVTGTLQPTVVDYLRLRGAIGRRVLLVPTLCNVLGMAACGMLASRAEWRDVLNTLRHSRETRVTVAVATAVDLFSGMLLTAGLMHTGGGVFTVLYNSVPAWTAILARIALGRRLSAQRTAGVGVVCLGLALNVVGTHQHAAAAGSSSWSALAGSAAVLLGSMLHSAMFLLSERAV